MHFEVKEIWGLIFLLCAAGWVFLETGCETAFHKQYDYWGVPLGSTMEERAGKQEWAKKEAELWPNVANP